jgi:putative ABC transport system ATP-binding protein
MTLKIQEYLRIQTRQLRVSEESVPSALYRALLGELGVQDRADHRPAMLSGGQQQRVAVARALANQPSIMLADEPTAALDSHRGRQVMALFCSVAREHGTGVIVVTHDHRALDVFDTIYEMEDGQIGTAQAPTK